jgi:hypothetical protein
MMLEVGFESIMNYLPFKEQVMLYPDISTSCLIGVEMPILLLPFGNCYTNIFVVINLHANVIFHINSPLFYDIDFKV